MRPVILCVRAQLSLQPQDPRANDGNRTRVTCLGSMASAIELRSRGGKKGAREEDQRTMKESLPPRALYVPVLARGSWLEVDRNPSR